MQKKKRKTIKWERLEISSRKLETIKGTFHVRMGTIKDRKGQDQTEAEDIKKCDKNTQENYTRKFLLTWINTIMLSLT